MIGPGVRRAIVRLAMLAAVVGLVGPATAQDGGQAGNRYLRLDAVDTNGIVKGGPLVLFTSFLDKYGKPVAVPADADWTVSFDGEPAKGEKKVMRRRESDHPVHVVVVVSAVETLRGEAFDTIKEATASLISGLRRNDTSAAVGYGDIVEDTTNLSPQHEDTVSWLRELDPKGTTPQLYEGIRQGLALFPSAFDTFGHNRAMLVITDGADKDEFDATRINDHVGSIQSIAKDLNVRITVIGVDIAGLGKLEQVRKLGEPTGGLSVKATTPAEIQTQVANFRSELQDQYVIEIEPAGLEGGKEVGFKVELEHGGQPYSTDTVMQPAPEPPSNLMLYLAVIGGGLLGLLLLFFLIRAIVRAIRNREPEGPVVESPDLRPCVQCGNQIPIEWKVCQYCEALPHHGRLTVLGGAGDALQGRAFFIKESQTNIGAAENNHVALPVAGVSKRHAGIQVQDGRFELADYGSMNGTFIEGTRISKQFLKDGNEVQLGPVKLEFKLKK